MVGVASHTSGVLLSRPHMSSVVRSLFFAECACRGGDVCRPSPPPLSNTIVEKVVVHYHGSRFRSHAC